MTLKTDDHIKGHKTLRVFCGSVFQQGLDTQSVTRSPIELSGTAKNVHSTKGMMYKLKT